MHEEGATGAVGRTTSVGDRTRTCGTSRDSPPLRSSARRNPIDTVCDGVACSDTRLTVRDPRYRRPCTPYLCGRRERVPAIARRQPPIGPGPSSRTARLDHSTTRRDAGERSASASASACGAARSPLADFDLTPTRHVSAKLVIGSLAERRQHKRQPAGRRSRWTEREHLPMASPCRTRPREPEARARCGLSGSHARPSRARLAVGSSVVHPARALVAERSSTVCATPALAPRRRRERAVRARGANECLNRIATTTSYRPLR